MISACVLYWDYLACFMKSRAFLPGLNSALFRGMEGDIRNNRTCLSLEETGLGFWLYSPQDSLTPAFAIFLPGVCPNEPEMEI